jgi:hypothetical protein
MRIVYLNGLGILFGHRNERLGDPKDFEASLQKVQESIALISPDHPDRAVYLTSLATSFQGKYQRFWDAKDLEAALQIMQEVVDLTPQEHPKRASHLHIFAKVLTYQYRVSGDLKVLDTALQTHQEVVDLTLQVDPELECHLQALAFSFLLRYQKSRKIEDLQAAHRNYEVSFNLPSPVPERSWAHALQWASLTQNLPAPYCVSPHISAFALLPEILWIGHSIPVRHNAVHRLNISGATSAAIHTCINVSSLIPAVEIMEQGLATIFQQMLQLKTNADTLHPDQAESLKTLSAQLYRASSNSIKLVNDRKKLLEQIRMEPGHAYFLRPTPYSALRNAAQGGPVVILSSQKDHCDGLIILDPSSDPVHIRLPHVTVDLLKSRRELLKQLLRRCNIRNRDQSPSSRLFGKREQFSTKPIQECFTDMLAWLWTTVVAPIYQVLNSVSKMWSFFFGFS